MADAKAAAADARLAAYVRASTATQGMPLKVKDKATIVSLTALVETQRAATPSKRSARIQG